MKPGQAERRAKSRISLEFRAVQARARIDGKRAEILNMGPAGMLARVGGMFEPDPAIALDVEGLGTLAGRIVWHRGDLVGIVFEPPLATERFRHYLEGLGEERRPMPKPRD